VTIASIFSRLLAAFIFITFLACFGVYSAQAQTPDCNSDVTGEVYPTCPNEGAAYLAARNAVLSKASKLGMEKFHPNPDCTTWKGGTYWDWRCFVRLKSDNSPSSTVGVAYRSFLAVNSCSSKPDITSQTGPWSTFAGNARNGTIQCNGGCETLWSKNSDGTWTGTTSASGFVCEPYDKNMCSRFSGYHWNGEHLACEPDSQECTGGKVSDGLGGCKESSCPPGQVQDSNGLCVPEKSECPPGNVKAPSGACLPGDGQCAKGEVRGKDGTCKRDANEDGKPDEGEDEGNTDEAFSGGDNCNAPPACSGSPIMCGQARIQWRIDCNTRKNRNISGGTCSSTPVCTGEKCDALEYSQLLMQWRTACAIEKMAGKGNDQGDNSQPEWTKVGGMNQDPGAGATPADTPNVGEREFSTSDLDQSGFGGGSCIGLASGSASGEVGAAYSSVFAAPDASWCLLISRLRASLIVCAAALACFIIARGAT
jgi:hypothetical protein